MKTINDPFLLGERIVIAREGKRVPMTVTSLDRAGCLVLQADDDPTQAGTLYVAPAGMSFFRDDILERDGEPVARPIVSDRALGVLQEISRKLDALVALAEARTR